MTDDLKPCPFCGAEMQFEEDGYEHPFSDTCPLDSLYIEDRHVAAWNRRATPTVQEAAKVPEIAEALRLAGQFAIACRIARSSLGPHADTGHLEAIALRYIRWPDMTNLDAALRAIAGDSHG